MTSFQDARDEYFQDVERNKVCSSTKFSAMRIFIVQISQKIGILTWLVRM